MTILRNDALGQGEGGGEGVHKMAAAQVPRRLVTDFSPVWKDRGQIVRCQGRLSGSAHILHSKNN